MIASSVAIVLALALLWLSADRLVVSTGILATRLRIAPIVIGMLAIGFGTSLPELAVSVSAAMADRGEMALGNVLGSNIVNIGVIVGLTAVLTPIPFEPRPLFRHLAALLVVSLIAGISFLDGQLTRIESLVLTTTFVAAVCSTLLAEKEPLPKGSDPARSPERLVAILAAVIISLALIVLSSKLLLWGTARVAQQLGMSDLMVGLSITAIGTSLPEFIVSMTAILRRNMALALGNVVGSNLFNTAAVIGVAGSLTGSTEVPTEVIQRDFPFVALLTFSIFFMALFTKKRQSFGRLQGLFLLMVSATYYWLLFGDSLN